MSTWTAVIGVIEMDDIFPLLTNNSLDDQISDIKKVEYIGQLDSQLYRDMRKVTF